MKTTPIVISLPNGFAVVGFNANDVDGAGIKKREFEAELRAVVARFAYSRTAPGLIVLHALAGNVLQGTKTTVLGHLKFFRPNYGPRSATPEFLRGKIRRELALWKVQKTDAEIEADIEHLLAPPSEFELERYKLEAA